MPRGGFKEISLKGFAGLDFRGPEELINNKGLSEATNFNLGSLGELKKRPGIVRLHNGTTLAGTTKLIGHFWTGRSGTKSSLLASSNVAGLGGKLWKSINGGVNWTQISTPAGTNYTFGKGIQYADVFYIPTSAGLVSWDGTTYTNFAAINTSFNAVLLQFRMFTFDPVAKAIKFSDPGNFASIPASNFIGFVPDGEEFVGFVEYRDKLVCFRNRSIWVLYLNGPPASWTLKKLPFDVGAISQDAIQVIDGLIYFTSMFGVYRTDLTQMEEISKPIKNAFLSRPLVYANYNAPIVDSLGYYNNRVICQVKTSAFTPPLFRIFIFNIITSGWTEWIPSTENTLGYNFNPITNFLNVPQGWQPAAIEYTTEKLYMAGADAGGRIYGYNEVPLDPNPLIWTDDDATSYLTRMRTKEMDMDESFRWKRSPYGSVRIKSASGGVTGKYTVNDVAGANFPITSDATEKQTKFKGPGFFRKLELEIADTSPNNLEIHEIELSVKEKPVLTDTRT
jgi:hypothetical protein